jgi:hypothetical protein
MNKVPMCVPGLTDPRLANVGPTAQRPGEYRGPLAIALDPSRRVADIGTTAQLPSEYRGRLADVIPQIIER